MKINENDVFIVTGDHGRSSRKEILVPLVIISPRFQIDLTSTISSLLKIGIPSNNLEIQIESILHKYFYIEKIDNFSNV